MDLKIIPNPHRPVPGLLNPNSLPDTMVCHLYDMVNAQYLLLPPDPLFALMGTVAANMMGPDMVWLLFIGPSSCGKSELLKSLMHVPGVYFESSITSEAAYLSCSKQKDRAPTATGGILYQIGQGGHGMIVMDDITRRFSTHLSESDRKLLAFERDIHSGHCKRSAGADGGMGVPWTGQVGMAAGCTPVIDRFQEISGQLGERWMYFRWPVGNDDQKTALRLSPRKPGWQDDLREVIKGFFSIWTHLEFGNSAEPPRELTTEELDHIKGLSKVAARCRSAVERDPYNKVLTGWHDNMIEGSSRIAVGLKALYLGMDRIGVPDDYRWRIVEKCALDSMPAIRQGIIRACITYPGAAVTEIHKLGRVDEQVLARALGDLSYLDVLTNNHHRGRRPIVTLNEQMSEDIHKYFKELLDEENE